jgi:hypothetical protein
MDFLRKFRNYEGRKRMQDFFKEFGTDEAMMQLFMLDSKRQLDYLIAHKKLPVIRVAKGKRCFHLPSVREWLLERGNQGQ